MLLADAIRKMDRLEQIVILFRGGGREGVGTAEISRLLGVSQRTARRYVKELSEHGRLPVYRQGRVWRLEEGGHTDRLRSQLNLDEAVSLYLAARMLSASSDGHDPQRVASLLQLAAILPDTIGGARPEGGRGIPERARTRVPEGPGRLDPQRGRGGGGEAAALQEGGPSCEGVGLAGAGGHRGRPGRALHTYLPGQSRPRDQVLDPGVGAGVRGAGAGGVARGDRGGDGGRGGPVCGPRRVAGRASGSHGGSATRVRMTRCAFHLILSLLGLTAVSAEPLVEGRVRLASGQPVRGAQVLLFDLADPFLPPVAATTDEAGWFALPWEAFPGRAVPERFGVGTELPQSLQPFHGDPLPAADRDARAAGDLQRPRAAPCHAGRRPASGRLSHGQLGGHRRSRPRRWPPGSTSTG